MRDFTLYLEDIVQSMQLIQCFVEGMDCAAFTEDEKTRSAVVR